MKYVGYYNGEIGPLEVGHRRLYQHEGTFHRHRPGRCQPAL